MTEPQNNFQPPDPQYRGPQYPGPQQPGPQYQGPQPSGPMRPDEERTWSLLAHIGTIVLGFIAPLVVLLVKGNDSPTVRANAVESLNFQITVTIGYIASYILMFILIGFITLFAVWALAIAFAIIGTMAASKGEAYRYPFALRLVK